MVASDNSDNTPSEYHQSRNIKGLDKLYEFEHEPVSDDKLQPGRYFAGLFAGEHVAATEFVIGALFVTWGVKAYDIFVGLLIGNLLAVLTWTLICVPIAVQTRLTLYWYLRKITGPITTVIYNIVNAVLFCILAGCMITVASSAVRIPFGIPPQTNWYPTDYRFVLIVIGVGTVVVTLAILGFKKLAQFATVCSPWLLLMFFAGAVSLLPGLAKAAGIAEIKSFEDFWTIANKLIWTGHAPDGKTPLSFWQVAAFAWICNLSTHAGLTDMALFRYAKRASYGLYSIFGMFLGHYLAWICAGVMGAAAAVAMNTTTGDLDSGGVAMHALGVCGVMAVIIAGWTTANPTLYRVGLAFSAITPGWPRWLVTMIAGVIITIIACFPFVFSQLIAFVGYLGILLMPIGAVVFTEHWIFPRIGFTRYWVSHKKLLISWPALLSWAIAVALSIYLEQAGIIHLFYLFIPIWMFTMGMYIIFAAMAGAREPFHEPLEDDTARSATSSAKKAQDATTEVDRTATTSPDVVLWISRIVAVASLLVCFAMPIWLFTSDPGNYDDNFTTFKQLLIWPTLVYFVSGTTWAVKRNKAA